VFEDSLIELVKNVGGHREMNVEIGKSIPEWTLYGTRNPFGLTQGVKLMEVAGFGLGVLDHPHGPCLSARFSRHIGTKLRCWALTFGTSPILSTGDQTLFRIVCHVTGKNGVYPPDLPISTNHFHPITPSLL
jgi:hypothetical protein